MDNSLRNNIEQYISGQIRNEQFSNEKAVVVSPGARDNGWPVVILALREFNVYDVRIIFIGSAGVVPVAAGPMLAATNVAEPYWQEGQLASGSYAIMFRASDGYVFYAKP